MCEAAVAEVSVLPCRRPVDRPMPSDAVHARTRRTAAPVANHETITLCARAPAEAKPAAASSSSAGGGGAPSRQACRSDLVELSDVAARPALLSAPEEQPKTILVVGLGGGVLCNRGTLDW